MKPIISPDPDAPAMVLIDRAGLAAALQTNPAALQERIFNLGMQQIWLQAKQAGQVTDTVLVTAARQLLKLPALKTH